MTQFLGISTKVQQWRRWNRCGSLPQYTGWFKILPYRSENNYLKYWNYFFNLCTLILYSTCLDFVFLCITPLLNCQNQKSNQKVICTAPLIRPISQSNRRRLNQFPVLLFTPGYLTSTDYRRINIRRLVRSAIGAHAQWRKLTSSADSDVNSTRARLYTGAESYIRRRTRSTSYHIFRCMVRLSCTLRPTRQTSYLSSSQILRLKLHQINLILAAAAPGPDPPHDARTCRLQTPQSVLPHFLSWTPSASLSFLSSHSWVVF